MYVCTISTLFVVVVVCMYVQESPVCIFYPMAWYLHMVLTAILSKLLDPHLRPSLSYLACGPYSGAHC